MFLVKHKQTTIKKKKGRLYKYSKNYFFASTESIVEPHYPNDYKTRAYGVGTKRVKHTYHQFEIPVWLATIYISKED